METKTIELNEGSLLEVETFHQTEENKLYCQIRVSHRNNGYLFLLDTNEVTGFLQLLEIAEDEMLNHELSKIGV